MLMMMMPWKDVLSGFKPVNPNALLKDLYGAPCDCRGGNTLSQPHTHLKSVDCGTKTAFLEVFKNSGGPTQHWICVDKPKYLSPGSPCPGDCVYTDQMNIRCYSSYSECTNGGRSYFTAKVNQQFKGSAGGDWSVTPQIWGPTNKYSQASCTVPVGKLACWNKIAPVHVSDGGGPTDAVREVQVHEEVQKWIDSLIPRIHYHPLLLPKPKGVDIDTQTFDIIEATHSALNISNPRLVQDCWLCLAFGNSWPLALPSSFNGTFESVPEKCSLISPFKVQPVAFNMTMCVYKHYQNNTFDIDVGTITFASCDLITNISSMLCSPMGHVFVCGGNMAYTTLPTNGTGLCALATLLPDVELIPGDEPVPIPTFDYISPRHKRAVQFIPLLVGMGVASALGTGTAGLDTAISSYSKLSQQLSLLWYINLYKIFKIK